MEKTENIFDPDHYLIDHKTRVVYRKEQFVEGEDLPEELLVRDRRYTKEGIEGMCERLDLEIIWTRFVRAGGWHESLSRSDDHAKEILVLCKTSSTESGVLSP